MKNEEYTSETDSNTHTPSSIEEPCHEPSIEEVKNVKEKDEEKAKNEDDIIGESSGTASEDSTEDVNATTDPYSKSHCQ